MLSDRTERLTVRLSAEEVAQIDRARAGLSRGAYIRSLLREGKPAASAPSHAEAIAILAEQARDGSATAATARGRRCGRSTAIRFKPRSTHSRPGVSRQERSA
jgi:hypothetical protein